MPIFDIEKYLTDFITNPGEPEIVADCEYKEIKDNQTTIQHNSEALRQI